MKRCANSEALSTYEDEIASNEKKFEYFIDTVLESEVVNLYEESRAEYNRLAENYNIENYSYEEFVKDSI